MNRQPPLPPEEAALLRQQAHLERVERTAECLDEMAIADVVDGRAMGPEGHEIVAHLARCAHCRSAVRATAALASDESVAREIRREGGSRRWLRAAVGIGVAAAAGVLVMTLPSRDRQVTLRESAVASAIAPVTLSPRGEVRVADTLAWSRVPGAERYRLRVHQSDGMVIWSTETEDSSAVLPDSVRLDAGATYHWRVEALTGWRRWVESEMTQFRIRPDVP